MKTLLIIAALIAIVAISAPAEAQSFHAPKMRKIQKDHARKHGAKIVFKKQRQATLYRQKRKQHKKQLYK